MKKIESFNFKEGDNIQGKYEILKYLEPYKKILVLGCDGCTHPPRSLKEAEIYAELIEIAGKLNNKGFECKTTTISRQCDNHLVATNLPPEFEDVDAVLSMACGIGPQTIAEVFPELKIFPAQDTNSFPEHQLESAFFCLTSPPLLGTKRA